MAHLSSPWHIGDVEIPSRIVLAPMAGVSVQAFRRQGRRFGAGLVCSEMVSSCGLSYGNERTLGYLRIARDEHPLAVQIFGSEPERMAEAAQMVVAAGADIVDINFGCPVRKVTKTGAGASALEDHDLACALAGAVVDAVDVPVSVKMRRGVRNGSLAALDLLEKDTSFVTRLRENTRYFRAQLTQRGVNVREGIHPIVPILIGDTAKAMTMSAELLDSGVYVSGFGYPVVPQGAARLRCQISAAHKREHLDTAIEAIVGLAEKYGVVS